MYNVLLSMALLGFGVGTMFVNFHMSGFKHTCEKCESKSACVF